VFQAAVYRLRWAVGCAGLVEVGQHVDGAAVQGAAESDQLGEVLGTPWLIESMTFASGAFAATRSLVR